MLCFGVLAGELVKGDLFLLALFLVNCLFPLTRFSRLFTKFTCDPEAILTEDSCLFQLLMPPGLGGSIRVFHPSYLTFHPLSFGDRNHSVHRQHAPAHSPILSRRSDSHVGSRPCFNSSRQCGLSQQCLYLCLGLIARK
ncbi:hypothetical protein BKA81DRAFT_359388 [Phyllosticta paracitricarpa]